MHLLPVLPSDLTVSVGVSAATFALGMLVWWRNKWATGNALYGVLATVLSFWTVADWLESMQSTALPLQVLIWKLIFYLGVCFGPAIIIHASSYLAKRTSVRRIKLAYLLGFVSFLCIALGFELKLFPIGYFSPEPCLTAGAVLGFAMYAVALYFVATDLYPELHSSLSSEADRRRATYGIMIFLPCIMAGALQFITGPIPSGFFMPLLETWFLVISLMAFIRVAFLDVEFSALEAFLLLLAGFAAVMLLTSRDWVEAVTAVAGIMLVGAFGLLAIRTVRGEKAKRQLLEQINRELKMVEAAKNDFLDMVAHQLRTPLGGIRASASMLSSGDFGPLPEAALKNIALIENAASRLLSLADSYLNASRLHVGKFVSLCQTTDVRKEIQNVVAELSVSASDKHLTLRSVIDQSVPQTLQIDAEILQHVLFNLLDNAVKYTSEGGVTVSATADAENLTVNIRDTGPGMKPAEIKELFQKFHRGEAGRSRNLDGTGLGLYVVRRLTEAAGGKISAMSDGPGRGSVFTVSLPIGMGRASACLDNIDEPTAEGVS